MHIYYHYVILTLHSIFKCLMPTYNSAPKLIRRELKEAVKKYLIAKLGSESKFNDLAMVSTTQGNTYWTFGVPYDMRYEFREWAIKELRRRFGSVQVPEQGWEENN